MTLVGLRQHLVTLAGAGPPGQNSEGEFVPTTVPLDPPTWWCSINPASARDLERQTAGTVLATATFILEGDYHPGITTQTQITKDDGRIFYAAGVQNPEEKNERTIVFASERAA